MCIYIYTVCMYVGMYIDMPRWMDAGIHGCRATWMHGRIDGWIDLDGSMDGWMGIAGCKVRDLGLGFRSCEHQPATTEEMWPQIRAL